MRKQYLLLCGCIFAVLVCVFAAFVFAACSRDTGGAKKPGDIASHIMVPIAAGTFQMGGSYSVTLTGFYMGKYPVTQELYQAVMGSNPSYFSTADKRPVENVSWYDAIVFCNKLSTQEGLTPVYSINGSTDTAAWGKVPTGAYNSSSQQYEVTGDTAAWNAVVVNASANGYRLPTEAEWEYACRAGTSTTYNLGDTWRDDWGWHAGNSGSKTHDVGKKTPNAWGLYDMHGNVFEWCWGWYGSLSAGTDPAGPASGSYRVYRGGSWSSGAQGLRAAWRGYTNPWYRYYNLGFRLARGQ